MSGPVQDFRSRLNSKVFPLTPVTAFQNWARFTGILGYGVLNVSTVAKTAGNAYNADPEIPDMLAEVYSRAIFEQQFALHFDRSDTMVDLLVLQQIRETFGDAAALATHAYVAEHGPTRKGAVMLSHNIEVTLMVASSEEETRPLPAPETLPTEEA